MKINHESLVLYISVYDEFSLVAKFKELLGTHFTNQKFMDFHGSAVNESLYEELKANNINYCHYKSANPKIEPEIVVHFDILKNSQKLVESKWPKARHLLCLQECEVVKQSNWIKKSHNLFDRILAWNSDFIPLEKYYQIYTIQGYNGESDLPIKKGIAHKNRLLSLICSNNISKHPQELYSKRLECINWFEKNHSDEFDLYGYGWDSLPSGGGLITKIIKNIPFLSKKKTTQYNVYKGKVVEKRPVLEKYKFSICFENAKLIPGYITEKIFDCFIAGTIPIYLGAPNILDFISENCFINFKNFNSYEELYNYMISIPDREYLDYQQNIEIFLNSARGKKFSNKNYASILEKNILQMLNE